MTFRETSQLTVILSQEKELVPSTYSLSEQGCFDHPSFYYSQIQGDVRIIAKSGVGEMAVEEMQEPSASVILLLS